MRRRLAPLLAAAFLAGCGGDAGPAAPTSPEEVVRAWSEALNAGDDEAAADLFAENAIVVQGDYYATLATHGDAVRFNRSLPCSGEIVDLGVERNQVTATFLLGDRGASACDGPGRDATAIFVVEDGKIVVWQQVPPPGGEPPVEPEPGAEA